MAETQATGRRAGLKRQEALLGRLTRGADMAQQPQSHGEVEDRPAAQPAPQAPPDTTPAELPAQPPVSADARAAADASSADPQQSSAPEAARRSSPFAQLANKGSSSVQTAAMPSAPAPSSNKAFEELTRRADAPRTSRAEATGEAPGAGRRSATPEWNDEHRPAGSGYSPAEWEAARRFGPQSPQKLSELGEEAFSASDHKAWRFHVVEYVTAKERALLYVPSALIESDGDKTSSRVVDGRVVKESSKPPVDAGSLFLLPLDGCMLLGPGAATAFDMLAKPYSVVTHENPPEGDEHLYPWKVRVIRPATPPHGEMWAKASMDLVLGVLDEEGLDQAATSGNRPRGG